MKKNYLIKTVDQLGGWEEQIRTADDQNIVNGSGTSGQLTMDDFSDMIRQLETSANEVEGLNWIVVTGYIGWVVHKLKMSWKLYGRQKLPRKLKKRVYMTKKLRVKYLPEYYEKN